MMAFGFRVESTPKQSVRKRRCSRYPRKYRMMGQPVRVDSALLKRQDM